MLVVKNEQNETCIRRDWTTCYIDAILHIIIFYTHRVLYVTCNYFTNFTIINIGDLKIALVGAIVGIMKGSKIMLS